ncbi:MAG: hypothetical protein JXR63_02705 [Spirochaetales bacterium]|nr:hypothetical protein [Spirochaetales bacterium]
MKKIALLLLTALMVSSCMTGLGELSDGRYTCENPAVSVDLTKEWSVWNQPKTMPEFFYDMYKDLASDELSVYLLGIGNFMTPEFVAAIEAADIEEGESVEIEIEEEDAFYQIIFKLLGEDINYSTKSFTDAWEKIYNRNEYYNVTKEYKMDENKNLYGVITYKTKEDSEYLNYNIYFTSGTHNLRMQFFFNEKFADIAIEEAMKVFNSARY